MAGRGGTTEAGWEIGTGNTGSWAGPGQEEGGRGQEGGRSPFGWVFWQVPSNSIKLLLASHSVKPDLLGPPNDPTCLQ